MIGARDQREIRRIRPSSLGQSMTHGVSTASRNGGEMRSRQSLPLLLGALLSFACTPTRHVIRYDVATQRFDSIPPYIGTGDRVSLHVMNGLLVDRWVANTTLENLASEPNRAALSGAVDLKKIAAFPIEVLSAARASSEGERTTRDFGLSALPTDPGAGAELMQRARRDECSDDLDRLAQHLYSHPGDAAVLAFILSAESRSTAAAVASDTLPDRVLERLRRTAREGGQTQSADTVLTIRREGERYLRSVEALVASLPADQALVSDAAAFATHVRSVRTCTSRPLELHFRSERVNAPEWTGTRSVPARWIAGVDIAELVSADMHQGRYDSLHNNLVIIAHDATRVANALNILPKMVAERQDTLDLGTFFTPRTVTLKVVRQDRYPKLSAPMVVLTPFPSRMQPADTQVVGTVANVTIRVDPTPSSSAESKNDGKSGQTEDKKAEASGGAPQPQTVAQTQFDVLQRYRFRFAAGVARTPMRWTTFTTRDDSTAAGKGVYVSHGARTNSFLPVATLSYVIVPFDGKVFAANAYQNEKKSVGAYLEQAGLAASAGLSLSDPTESFVLGLATEPIPGLEVGYGVHIARAQSSSATHGSFVPRAEGDPIERNWRRKWGVWSLTIDAGVVVSSFGALLGLK